MIGFVLARLSYLNVGGSAMSSFRNGASPGEWYEYHRGARRVGITLHLFGCLPAGLLMVFQFVPAIRRKAMIVHRVNGYLVILLVFLSNAGALMIARRSFGGGLDTQTAVGVLVILTTVSTFLAYVNIKRLQIEQHRAWMLRAMFYLGTIITTRLIMIISATVTTASSDPYGQIMTCAKVLFIYDGNTIPVARLYPECDADGVFAPTVKVIVQASMTGGPEQIGASLALSFGPALWLAILLHLVGVELYLNLTPAESDRLRKISAEKQLEAGMPNPGSAGTTADRLGDAERWSAMVSGEDR